VNQKKKGGKLGVNRAVAWFLCHRWSQVNEALLPTTMIGKVWATGSLSSLFSLGSFAGSLFARMGSVE
jgi:hypothetical protein